MDQRKNIFLIVGILLSIASKGLQFQYGSLWGDFLILPAAIFFVLAILLNLPAYLKFLKNTEKRRSAKILAAQICAAVVSFQLFTMLVFGQGKSWGFFFLLLFAIFTALSLYNWHSLSKGS